MRFFCIHNSQGSVATCLKRGGIFKYEFVAGSVATCLKRGGIFKYEFVANLLPSRLLKKF